MKKLLTLFAAFAMAFSVAACDFGDDDNNDEDTTAPETDLVETDTTDVADEDVSGPCEAGESANLFFVRIMDDPANATLSGDCGAGNPGADIDGIVLVRPDGTEYYAASVSADEDVPGGVCDQNDKDDMNTVLGAPDGCVKDLGCGCGEYGYEGNPDCDCEGGDSKWLGYYSLNGGAIIVDFDESAEILCGDSIVVYEMYNPDLAGSVETYSVAYGTGEGNWLDAVDIAIGVGSVDVTWEW
jgi:hypothetical protein